jgi:hypothetical protein
MAQPLKNNTTLNSFIGSICKGARLTVVMSSSLSQWCRILLTLAKLDTLWNFSYCTNIRFVLTFTNLAILGLTVFVMLLSILIGGFPWNCNFTTLALVRVKRFVLFWWAKYNCSAFWNLWVALSFFKPRARSAKVGVLRDSHNLFLPASEALRVYFLLWCCSCCSCCCC